MKLQERLRDRAKKTWLKQVPDDEGVFPIMDLVCEAADALDAQEARIKALEDALRNIERADYRKWDLEMRDADAFVDWAKSRAREALKGA